MGYTGQVEPGGAAQHRVRDHVVISKCAVSEMNNNVYVLTCRATGAQLLIDAADDWPRIEQLLAEITEAGYTEKPPGVVAIATTHRHWDHVRALPDAAAALQVPTWAGADDADELPVPVDEKLRHGQTVQVGDVAAQVIGLRGHTPGSVALAVADPGPDVAHHIFSGDSLFPGGVGNTFGSAENFIQLLADVESRLFGEFDDTAWVYPGHGTDTTLGAERPALPQWRERGW